MILRRDPKKRNGFGASLRQARSQFHRGKRLIDRVERSGEKASLLAGDDGDGTLRTKTTDVLERCVGRAPRRVKLVERVAERRTIDDVRSKNSIDARRQVGVNSNCFGVKALERAGIFQIIEE